MHVHVRAHNKNIRSVKIDLSICRGFGAFLRTRLCIRHLNRFAL